MPWTISLGAHTFLNLAPSWMKLLMKAMASLPRRPVVSTAKATNCAFISSANLSARARVTIDKIGTCNRRERDQQRYYKVREAHGGRRLNFVSAVRRALRQLVIWP